MINVTQTFLPPLDEYIVQLQRIWDSKWLTNRGELIRELEYKLKSYLDIDNLLMVSNGTIALQIAIKALKLSGEIITTPFSYVATTSSIVWENCEPVFVDIDPDFLTIDETKIEAAITNKTSAILATHIYGNPCNTEVIAKIAVKHKLKVVYDAAHCFGVKYKGKSLLRWGDISTLSFHATKLFHTGEGGGIICNDTELIDRIYHMHNFGHNVDDTFWGLGINGKISEIQAAMGLAILPYNQQIFEARKLISEHYDNLLADTPLQKPMLRDDTVRNYAYYPILFPSEKILLKTFAMLAEHQINARRYFYPSLDKLPYVQPQTVPVSTDVSHRILCLPLYSELTAKQTEQICQVVKHSLKK